MRHDSVEDESTRALGRENDSPPMSEPLNRIRTCIERFFEKLRGLTSSVTFDFSYSLVRR